MALSTAIGLKRPPPPRGLHGRAVALIAVPPVAVDKVLGEHGVPSCEMPRGGGGVLYKRLRPRGGPDG